MNLEIIKLVLDAGIGVVSIAVIAYLFFYSMKAHRDEREKWREQIEKVTDALSDLVHNINDRK